MQAGPGVAHNGASQLTDDVRRATEDRAFECYSLGLYETALALMEAMQDEHADQITQLSACAALYMQQIRGGDNAYRSLSADEAIGYTPLSADEAPPAFRSLSGGSQATPGPHDSSLPADWTALPQDVVQEIFLRHTFSAAAADFRAAFSTGKLVCKPWKVALTQENNDAWRKAYFAHMYGLARGSELERVHLAEVADGKYLKSLEVGYWEAHYTKSFVPIQGYDMLVKRAVAHDEEERKPDHVIEVGHVQHIINHVCNVAEQVAVAAPTPVPKGREACIPNETKIVAHMFFNTLRMLKIPQGAVLPSQDEFDGPLFVVVRAVTDIWEKNITEVIDRITAKVKDFSVEHKERSCIFIDEFMRSAARWLKYIDDLYAKMRVQRLESCAAIGNREAQRLRQLSLEQAAALQT